MRAMVLSAPGAPLRIQERADPIPGDGEIRVKVSACGGLPADFTSSTRSFPASNIRLFRVTKSSAASTSSAAMSRRTGSATGLEFPGLDTPAASAVSARRAMENLCDRPLFTGYTRDGGFATHAIADAPLCFPLGEDGDDVSIAPLLCAGLIGWRSLVMAGSAERLGIYGFGAAGHIVAQNRALAGPVGLCLHASGDAAAQDFARRLGAVWAGASGQLPDTPLDAAIIYAPAGELCRRRCVRCARAQGRMRRHPHERHSQLSLRHSWEDDSWCRFANLTRQDGLDFLKNCPSGWHPDRDDGIPLVEATRSLQAEDGTAFGRRSPQNPRSPRGHEQLHF